MSVRVVIHIDARFQPNLARNDMRAAAGEALRAKCAAEGLVEPYKIIGHHYDVTTDTMSVCVEADLNPCYVDDEP